MLFRSAKPNGEITYQLGGNMLLRVDNRTFISSKTILGKRGVFNTYYVDSSLNEKMIIYVDPSYNKSYIYPYYEKDGNYTTNGCVYCAVNCQNNNPATDLFYYISLSTYRLILGLYDNNLIKLN